jgi:hypothetical protein
VVEEMGICFGGRLLFFRKPDPGPLPRPRYKGQSPP